MYERIMQVSHFWTYYLRFMSNPDGGDLTTRRWKDPPKNRNSIDNKRLECQYSIPNHNILRSLCGKYKDLGYSHYSAEHCGTLVASFVESLALVFLSPASAKSCSCVQVPFAFESCSLCQLSVPAPDIRGNRGYSGFDQLSL